MTNEDKNKRGSRVIIIIMIMFSCRMTKKFFYSRVLWPEFTDPSWSLKIRSQIKMVGLTLKYEVYECTVIF